MKTKLQLLLILLTIIIFSFPSISFSEMKTVTGEYCKIYLGDMKDKGDLDYFSKSVREQSIKDGLRKLNEKDKDFQSSVSKMKCISYINRQYLEKVVVVNHTEKGRKICEKVKITVDPEVIYEFIKKGGCPPVAEAPRVEGFEWVEDIYSLLKDNSDLINIGLIIETKISNLDWNIREHFINEEERELFRITVWSGKKYKLIDRRHLSKVLEEQKLSSSGITDNETVKLGKILNLDIIVLRFIYENNRVTKVLKVDTAEVLLFKNYEMK